MSAVKAFIIVTACITQLAKGDFTCPSEGLFADPDNCQNYFQLLQQD